MAPALQAGVISAVAIGVTMFLVLRIIVVVGAIFWLSPLRDPATTAAGSGGGLDSLGRLARAWSTLSEEDRAIAAKALPALAGAAARAAEYAAEPPAKEPPRTPPGPRAGR